MSSRTEITSSADSEFLRQGMSLLVQMFIELEISSQIEASPHERNQARRSYRNGYRRRAWSTRVGEITLEIPKLRKGSYYPAFLDALRDSEGLMLDALQETYHSGVHVNKIRELVEHFSLPTVDYSPIADTVEQLYNLVDRFRDKSRSRQPSNIITYRPVNAISALLVDSYIDENSKLPQSFYQQQPEDWLSDSLEVLTRLRQAMSNQTDAIAA
ncbi:MAG: transposase [Chloroflexi bacterium]|nr:transposase [Chloroflexota bacterium]MCC6896424.1 transposase [Anaerolineae bacterium]